MYVEPLTIDTLVSILVEPPNALLKQYQKLFKLEGATLEFHPKALQAVAKKAAAEETGARALRSVMENLMLDLMFELPDLVKIRKIF